MDILSWWIRTTVLCPIPACFLREVKMNNKMFGTEIYGMVTCRNCDSHGFIQNPKRQSCLTCGGFGFIITGAEQDANNSKYGMMRLSLKIGGTSYLQWRNAYFRPKRSSFPLTRWLGQRLFWIWLLKLSRSYSVSSYCEPFDPLRSIKDLGAHKTVPWPNGRGGIDWQGI